MSCLTYDIFDLKLNFKPRKEKVFLAERVFSKINYTFFLLVFVVRFILTRTTPRTRRTLSRERQLSCSLYSVSLEFRIQHPPGLFSWVVLFYYFEATFILHFISLLFILCTSNFLFSTIPFSYVFSAFSLVGFCLLFQLVITFLGNCIRRSSSRNRWWWLCFWKRIYNYNRLWVVEFLVFWTMDLLPITSFFHSVFLNFYSLFFLTISITLV